MSSARRRLNGQPFEISLNAASFAFVQAYRSGFRISCTALSDADRKRLAAAHQADVPFETAKSEVETIGRRSPAAQGHRGEAPRCAMSDSRRAPASHVYALLGAA